MGCDNRCRPSRDDFPKTEKFLKDLGADIVLTYDDLSDDERVRELVDGKVRESRS